jgi:Amiloride-sensitive sodium channel
MNFENNQFYPMQKLYLFAFADYLGYVGGIMGLLAGVSVLSLIEILYHFLSLGFSNMLNRLRSTRVQAIDLRKDARTLIQANEAHVLYQLTKYVIDFMKG